MHGRRFWLYKFRSMIAGAEAKKEDLLKKSDMNGPIFKMEKDPRTTRVGRFLRKTSLDEFPQFINVLKGEMSLVGTRPPTPDEVEQYEDPPITLLAKILPATQYALFTLEGEQITSDWPWEVSEDWLPQKGLQMSHPYHFQLYDERFKGLDPIDESILEVYVPVKPLDPSNDT